MEQSMNQMDSPTNIPPEALLPIVNKYFERFSAVQWNLLAAGIQDSDTTATLADLCAEVVQTLCTIVLRAVKPIIEESFHKKTPQADLSKSLENLDTNVGDSLSESFALALALDVQQDTYESAVQLTELIETEVSHKVNSIASEVINTSEWPSQPAVFVSGSMSNMKSLHQMVSQATKCLRKYLDKLKFQCLGDCWHPQIIESAPNQISETAPGFFEIEEPERCESSQSVKSKISTHSSIKSVSDILIKWSSETPDMAEENTNSPQTDICLKAEDAAYDILKIIREDLHYDNFEHIEACSEESSSQTPHFDMRLVVGKVREFFASHDTRADDTTDAKEISERRNFLGFAQRQFEKTMAELKNKFKAQDSEFLVRLKQVSRSCKAKLFKEEYLAPGEMAESSWQTPEDARPTGRMTIHSMNRKSPVDFDIIKTDVDILYEKLRQTKDAGAHASKTLEDIKDSGEIREFSKVLIDKIYNSLMTDKTYQFPVVDPDRCLSDSVIPGFTRRGGDTQFSPEVMYAMAEDMVGKLLQNLLLCMDKDPAEKTNYSEEVSGALTEIQDVITNALTKPEERTITPEYRSVTPEVRTTTPLVRITTPEKSGIILERKSVTPEIRTTTPLVRITTPQNKTTTPEKRSTTPRVRTATPEKSGIILERKSVTPENRTSSPRVRTATPEKRSTTPRVRTTTPEVIVKKRTPPSCSRWTPRPCEAGPSKSFYHYDDDDDEEEDDDDDDGDDLVIRVCVGDSTPNKSVPSTSSAKCSETGRRPSPVLIPKERANVLPSINMATDLDSLLLIRLLVKVQKTEGSPQGPDPNALTDRLSDIINIRGSSDKDTKKRRKKIYKAVFEDLQMEFGAPEKLLQAVMTSNTSFDDALVKYLEIHLDALANRPPKKSRVSRFFSAVGRAFNKPLKWFKAK